jgi:hypothetical protein
MPGAKMTFIASDVNGGALYTLTHNPAEATKIHKKRDSHTERTYRSEAFFNWGFRPSTLVAAFGNVGDVYVLRWPYMGITEWNMLKGFKESLQTITWDPKDMAPTGGDKYTIVPIELRGDDMHQNLSHKTGVEFEIGITGGA